MKTHYSWDPFPHRLILVDEHDDGTRSEPRVLEFSTMGFTAPGAVTDEELDAALATAGGVPGRNQGKGKKVKAAKVVKSKGGGARRSTGMQVMRQERPYG